MTKKEKVLTIIKRLEKAYPHPGTALNYSTPLELLVATILSAQTTDKTVNKVTPALFSKYKSARSFSEASFDDIDRLIDKINFHRNKAKNIKAACNIITQKYEGKIPDKMEELESLPGVGRKTANVVLGTVFKKALGIVVDTHVMRLARRLKLTDEKSPKKIEEDLIKIVPKDKWIDFSHLLILFGREYCPARKHKCVNCPLGDLCPDLELDKS